mmetsp:Transcript_20415/g.31908  ORF Transcript_20415/g.31908 Transcript_20415/m.31908 type:complete len:181 (+) Transcript_20415:362-904(+)
MPQDLQHQRLRTSQACHQIRRSTIRAGNVPFNSFIRFFQAFSQTLLDRRTAFSAASTLTPSPNLVFSTAKSFNALKYSLDAARAGSCSSSSLSWSNVDVIERSEHSLNPRVRSGEKANCLGDIPALCGDMALSTNQPRIFDLGVMDPNCRRCGPWFHNVGLDLSRSRFVAKELVTSDFSE